MNEYQIHMEQLIPTHYRPHKAAIVPFDIRWVQILVQRLHRPNYIIYNIHYPMVNIIHSLRLVHLSRHRLYQRCRHHSDYLKKPSQRFYHIQWSFYHIPVDIGSMELTTNVRLTHRVTQYYHKMLGEANSKQTIQQNVIDVSIWIGNIQILWGMMTNSDRCYYQSKAKMSQIRITFEYYCDSEQEQCMKSFQYHVWHRIHRQSKWRDCWTNR